MIRQHSPALRKADATSASTGHGVWGGVALPKLGRYKHRLSTEEKAARRKIKAYTNNMIRRGHIKRRTCCEACGSRFLVQGHHVHYEFPIELLWLCKTCHEDMHNFGIPRSPGLKTEFAVKLIGA